jgi:RNA polymerase sigma-70 factor, ECF subfamily
VTVIDLGSSSLQGIVDVRPGRQTTLESLSDFELIGRINDGDEAAFETLYHRHKQWVANLAFRWTGDRDTALDVLQETFAYVAKKFPGFRLTAKFTTFLYPAVRNLSIAARRKAERFELGEGAAQQLEDQPAAEPVADQEPIHAALSSLSEEHREVLLLRFIEGLDLREIAEAMEIPLGTVKSRLHHALQILRQDDRTRKMFEK